MDLLEELRIMDSVDGKGRKMEGWCTYEKALALANLVLQVKPKTVVELGVFGGRSLVAMGLGMKRMQAPGLVYGVDPWTTEAVLEGTMNEVDRIWWGQCNLGRVFGSCLEGIVNSGTAEWIRLLCCTSEQASKQFEQDSIDILHIDSNHSEETSTKEVHLWFPKVKRGGHIWFDDTDWPTTQKAIEMLSKWCNVVKDVKTCRLFQRT